MNENSNKIRTGFYLEKDLLDECDCFLEQSNSRSRNGLVRTISNMLAAANEVDDETLRELHIMCIDEVRKINGIITYDSAARFQRE